MSDETEELVALRATVSELSARLDAMERRDSSTVVHDPIVADGPMSRRHALRAAGVLAAGAIAGGAGVLASAAPAAAAPGTFDVTGGGLVAVEASAHGGASGVYATAYDSGNAVVGVSSTGIALAAMANSGYGALINARTHIALRNDSATIPTTRLTAGYAGDLVFDTNDDLWLCVVTGIPGTWRKIGGPASAGSFHAITPARVYDSRPSRGGIGPMIATEGAGAPGLPRSIYVGYSIAPSTGEILVADIVPNGARAIAANVTVTNTVNSGYLSINPGGDTTAHASTINWSSSGLTIANGVVLTLDDYRQLLVLCGPATANPSANLIIDVTGYWL